MGALDMLLAEHGVRCVMAVCTGSVATGTASPNSDFDLRWVFVRPVTAYLTIANGPPPDCIAPASQEDGADGDVDVEGWDLKKLLQLLLAGNVRAFELLESPTVAESTHCDAECVRLLRELAREAFSPKRAAFFYLSDARRHHKRWLTAAKPQVLRKKYLFVVRPLLCALWIRNHPRGPPPPLLIDELLLALRAEVPDAVQPELRELLRAKRAGEYSGPNSASLWPHFAALEEWYEPLLAQSAPLEDQVAALPDLDEDTKAALRVRCDALYCATVLHGLR